jgi:hypothetical protein
VSHCQWMTIFRYDSYDSNLFYWLWPKILQIQLDNFVEYWNNHKIQKQKEKPNMSGHTPRHAFTVCDSLCTTDCCISMTKDTIDALHVQIPQSQDEVICWVSNDFNRAAGDAYN